MSANIDVNKPVDLTERNRANAQHSTGPKTPEGKLKVSQNARKLGIFVADSTLEQEDPREFADTLAGYMTDYTPQGEIETELVRQLTAATHRLRRLERIETGVMYTDDAPKTRVDGDIIMGKIYMERARVIDQVERARFRAERSFNRVYKDLEARKAARPEPRPIPMLAQIVLNMKDEATPAFVRAGNVQNKPRFMPAINFGSKNCTVFFPTEVRPPNKEAA